jgi:transposase
LKLTTKHLNKSTNKQIRFLDFVNNIIYSFIIYINWTKIKKREKPKGQYFLRYSQKNLTEKQIWDSYNLTREVETSFRCLKSDLNIRPIHHQKDAYVEPYVWFGVVACQVVNYIR